MVWLFILRCQKGFWNGVKHSLSLLSVFYLSTCVIGGATIDIGDSQFGWGTKVYVWLSPTAIASVTIWPGGPNRYITQFQWFMYQNRSEPSSSIWHWSKRNQLSEFHRFFSIQNSISGSEIVAIRILLWGLGVFNNYVYGPKLSDFDHLLTSLEWIIA